MRVTRAERVEQIASLRAEGLTNRQVGARLGVSESAVNSIINDPDGSKQRERRQRYQGACVDCGKPTSGCNGREKAPKRCPSCAADASRIWTRENIIDAIRRFAAIRGRPPTAMEWYCVDHEQGFPSFGNVYGVSGPFASWNEAIEAAGFASLRTGQSPDQQKWDRESVIEAVRRWVDRYGDLPAESDWRYAGDGYPHYSTANYYFGSWNAMIAAAGFTPRRKGERRKYRAVAA